MADYSELVERLEAWPERPYPELTTSISHMMNKASDAIQLLQAENAILRAQIEVMRANALRRDLEDANK